MNGNVALVGRKKRCVCINYMMFLLNCIGRCILTSWNVGIHVSHRGGAFRLFGPTVFNFLCGLNPADVIAGVSEVPDPSIRKILKRV